MQVRQKQYYEQEDGELGYVQIAPEQPHTKKTVGPWPRTQEERERAAKKYNMIPEDYKPFPENEGFGDYPDFKAVGEFNRDKYDDFDDPDDYRFYGEPFHLDYDMYKWERFDPLINEKPQYLPPWSIRLMVCWGLPLFMIGLTYYCRENRINFNPPYKSRTYYPNDNRYGFAKSPNDGTAPHVSHH